MFLLKQISLLIAMFCFLPIALHLTGEASIPMLAAGLIWMGLGIMADVKG